VNDKIQSELEAYKIAARHMVINPKKHEGELWYYSEIQDQYLTTKNNTIIPRVPYKKAFFKTKGEAKLYRKHRCELFRLISIQVDHAIENTINEINLPENLKDVWRKEFWYSRECY